MHIKEDYITETQIVELTGARQGTVHKWLKAEPNMITKQLTKRITLYHVKTLPGKIANLLREKGYEF